MGCKSKSAAGGTDVFPATNTAPGWAKSSDTRTFEASHLWEYIDGDAEKYLQAGVVRTLTSDYRFHDKVDATADVYVMAKPEGAKKIFDSDSAVESHAVNVGEGGRAAKGSLTFHQGPYYVRVVAYEDTAEVSQAAADLAHAISSRLAESR
jgi:hypothetical protein